MSRGDILSMQLHRVVRSKMWRYALLVSLVAMAVAFVQSCLVFWGHDVGELPSAGVAWVGNSEGMQTFTFAMYLFFLMPILCAAVFGDSFYSDVRARRASCIVTRSSLRGYVTSGALVTFVSGLVVALVPLLVSQLLSFIAFPAHAGQDAFSTFLNTSASKQDQYGTWAEPMLLSGLFFSHRYLFNLVYILYDALWAGIFALCSFVISLYTRRSRLVVLGAPTIVLLVSSAMLPMGGNLGMYMLVSMSSGLSRSIAFFVAAPLGAVAALFLLVAYATRSRRDLLL